MRLPKISIVTPSYNQGQYLEETLRSVLDQRYPHLEYVVIDGGSKDQTVDVIKRHEKQLTYWVSEKDRGQVHALNKGLAHCTGDILGFVNSDDLYLPGALQAVGDWFARNPASEWICGDTVMFGVGFPTKLVVATVPKTAAHALSWASKAPQPGMFWRRRLVAGGFKEDWPYDFDHEMYVRLLLSGHHCEHLPLPVAAYRLHAASKTVAENAGQIREFELLSEVYEPQLTGSGRRWCRATRFLRESYKASEKGDTRAGARWLAKSLLTYPEAVADRPFWGCVKKLAKSRLSSMGRST